MAMQCHFLAEQFLLCGHFKHFEYHTVKEILSDLGGCWFPEQHSNLIVSFYGKDGFR